MIIDCFTFYNELDLLEFRLEELNGSVDKFVLVEGTTTHTGKNKLLFFENNKLRYRKYLDKIIHIIVDDLNSKDPWQNENAQRNAIDKGISQISLNDNDILLISDLDEIPDIKTIDTMIYNNLVQNHMLLKQDLYYYNLTCKLKTYEDPWAISKAKVLNYKTYTSMNRSPQNIRISHTDQMVERGGWHFSYFGNIDFIKNKIENMAHQEFNNIHFNTDKKIADAISGTKDLFGRHYSFEYIDPKDNLYLPKNYTKLMDIK